MIQATTTTITVNYTQEPHKVFDLHNPAEFTHTSYTTQEMAINPPPIAYSGNFVFACVECDESTVVQLLTFTSVNFEKITEFTSPLQSTDF
jgi:hypothetical protein